MTLTNTQIPQIITLVDEWDWEVKRVAFEYHVSPSRIYQIVTEYRRTGVYPVIHTRGPKPKVLTEKEREIIIDAKKRLNLGTCREVEVYVQQGYPVRTYESNTFCWIEVRFTACSPYWTSTEETAFKHNTAFVNDGDYPAECKLILSVTVRYVALDGVQIMAFRDSSFMTTHYVTITDSSITATDTSGNNILYKFTLDSKFPLIPTGEHTYYGCKGTFRKRWGHA